MKCQQKGCDREAGYYPRVTVPPKGYPADRGVTFSLSLQLCLYHLNRATKADLFTDETGEKLSTITQIIARSDVPLDFTRAKIRPAKIGDRQWQLFQQGRD